MMKRLITIIILLTVLTGAIGLPAVSAGNVITINLHIAGRINSLYYDEFTMVDTSRHGWTIIDMIKEAQIEDDWLDVYFKNTENGTHISEINELREGDSGPGTRWCYRVNGKSPLLGMDEYLLEDGDEVEVYFADPDGVGIQYPEFEITEGEPGAAYDYCVTFTSYDTTYDSFNNSVVTKNPIAGADVMWDGKDYKTDGSGRVYIPGTGRMSGYHSVRIERFDKQTGIPTVLRLPPGYLTYVPFVDLPQDAWYSKAVMEILHTGHMRGVGDNKFAPERPMTMAELLVVLWRISGQGYETGPDVPWYEPALNWATKTGVLFDERYSLSSNVTREIFIYMLYKSVSTFDSEIVTLRSDITGAADYVNVAPDFREAVSWTVAMEIIRGTSGDRLVINPDAEINRAEVCQMIYNYFMSYAQLAAWYD